MTFPARFHTIAAWAPIGAVLCACAASPTRPDEPAPRSSEKPAAAQVTPLLAPWQGPWGGVPPFGRFKPADLKPALEAAMAENLAEIDRIAADPSAPTFDNTIVAMERGGQSLQRVGAVYNVYTSTMNDEEVQGIEREMSPKLAAFNDRIVQNGKLFARIDAVYAARDRLQLTPEQQRLLWVDYTYFVRAGAKLDAAAKGKLSDLNQKLAGLYTKFSQNVLAEEGSQMVLLEKEADLAGLPGAVRDGAAAAAAGRGKPGQWVITNTRSSVD